MKKISGYTISALLLLVLFIPQQSLAYLPTDQFAVRLNENTFLFGITYRFSFMYREIEMPIRAMRGIETGNATSSVGYEFRTKNGDIFSRGTAYGLILSETPIGRDTYTVENSKAGYFTLISIFTLNEPLSVEESESIKMQVNRLPFKLSKTDESEWALLGAKELESYQTSLIEVK